MDLSAGEHQVEQADAEHRHLAHHQRPGQTEELAEHEMPARQWP